MSDYFHESMVAKMVSSNGYQEGYSVGFASGYNQGKADRDKEIAEHNVFFSNKPIEDIVLDARAEVLAKVSNLKNEYTDACNMCIKTDCDVCAINNFIEQMENIISNE